jgi:hypothetical protein
MPHAKLRFKSLANSVVRSSLTVLGVILVSSCGDATGLAVSQTFTLYTVDRNYLPAAISNTDGRTMTIGIGRLQGTDVGPSCGMSLQLINGPITSLQIPNCKLEAGKEITFTATLTDSRFPSGAHEYRFVPL